MNRHFDIQLEGVSSFSTTIYFRDVETGIECAVGGGTSGRVSTLSWGKMGVKIAGGPKFTKYLTECGENVDELKGLCWNYMSGCLQLGTLQKMLAETREEGRRAGRAEIQDGIKDLLEIHEYSMSNNP